MEYLDGVIAIVFTIAATVLVGLVIAIHHVTGRYWRRCKWRQFIRTTQR